MIRYLFVYRVKFENILQVVSTSFTVIIVSIVSLHMRMSRDIVLIFHMQLSLMIDELENPEIEMSLCGNTSLGKNLTPQDILACLLDLPPLSSASLLFCSLPSPVSAGP
mmetsp:Transcript_17424/g.29533  ORF Transcript_17424/g.29533 Transcript_17424/m.29533 type:complete len:109 (-) Transcript_17424:839-1165(-)